MAMSEPGSSWGPGTNIGHGHVWPRPDGAMARCGGPARCDVCSKDAERLAVTSGEKPSDMQPGVYVAYYPDYSGMNIFADEMTCLRHAVEHSMSVKFVEYGGSIR
jgi:hypothetical protein